MMLNLKKISFVFLMLTSLSSIGFAGPQEDLIDAIVRKNHFNAVEALRHSGEINFSAPILSTEKKDTIVTLAARVGDVKVMSAILDMLPAISDVYAKESGFAPLTIAAQEGHIEVVELLLNRGANPNWRTSEFGYTALRSGIEHPGVIRVLLSRGANPNILAEDGATPLSAAISFNRLESAQILAEKSDLTVKLFQSEMTYLHFAAERGNVEATQMLIASGADVHAMNKLGNTPLSYAAHKGKNSVAQVLIQNGAQVNHCNKEGSTPLLMAVHSGNVNTAETLIRAGANIHESGIDTLGVTAMHVAAMQPNTDMLYLLQRYGANWNTFTTVTGFAPLHLAVSEGTDDIAKALIQLGADINQTSKEGTTPLVRAAQFNRSEIAAFLIQVGANTEGCTFRRLGRYLDPSPSEPGKVRCCIQIPPYLEGALSLDKTGP
jgi:ankyrin repeat protein